MLNWQLRIIVNNYQVPNAKYLVYNYNTQYNNCIKNLNKYSTFGELKTIEKLIFFKTKRIYT